MELPCKILEQIAFKTRPKKEAHVSVVKDKRTREEHLSQPLQTNIKQFRIAVTFLTGYNGIFKVTYKNNKFYCEKSITDGDDFFQTTILPGDYETENLSIEIKRIIINERLYGEEIYPFKIKPNFTTLESNIEILPRRPIISFMLYDNIGDPLGFNAVTKYEQYNLSTTPVDILSFDNFLLEGDVAQGMIYRRKRSVIFHNFTMDVDPGYKFIEKFRGGVQWYMMESKDIISSICFKLRKLK